MLNALNSVLEARGPQAGHIEHLWWVMLWVCTAVWIAVMIALVIALLRRRAAVDAGEPPQSTPPQAHRWIGLSLVITGVILFAFLVTAVITDRRLDRIESANALTLTVTGHQWWWDVRYDDSDPSKVVVTANEIHVPVGRPVHLQLKSPDVIHSFWVPSLDGKRDLIPGKDNSLWIQADRAGEYRGQCAEFCGYQHAHMGILVVAQPEAEFNRWLEAQRGLAHEPTNDVEKRGREVFMSTTCVMCHSVRGTPAGSRTGPDLTHLATRKTIAAGTVPNTIGYLAGWILDPQKFKPGTRMPPHAFEPADLHALLAYLTSLK
jgi:cytochrome c oxidase subunit II